MAFGVYPNRSYFEGSSLLIVISIFMCSLMRSVAMTSLYRIYPIQFEVSFLMRTYQRDAEPADSKDSLSWVNDTSLDSCLFTISQSATWRIFYDVK